MLIQSPNLPKDGTSQYDQGDYKTATHFTNNKLKLFFTTFFEYNVLDKIYNNQCQTCGWQTKSTRKHNSYYTLQLI